MNSGDNIEVQLAIHHLANTIKIKFVFNFIAQISRYNVLIGKKSNEVPLGETTLKEATL